MTSWRSRTYSLEPGILVDGPRASVLTLEGHEDAIASLPQRQPIRVLIVEDSRLIAEALMFTLDSVPTLEPVGYALDGWEAIGLAAFLDPDVILVGSRLRGLDCLAFTQLMHLVRRETQIIVLAEPHAPHDGEEAVVAGAADYLPLDRSTDELVEAITQAWARQARFESLTVEAAP